MDGGMDGGIWFIVLSALIALAPILLFAKTFFKGRAPRALEPGKKVALKLAERKDISHDTRLFRFALQSPKHVLGLPVGKHIVLSYTDKDGEEVGRAYTPTSSDDDVGYVDFVIKVYFANVHPNFPEGGMMSQHMEGLKVGDTLDFEGPKGKYEYLPGVGISGVLKIQKLPIKANKFEERTTTKIGMIAGGTGITPMLQVVEAIRKDPSRKIEVSLLFANQTEDDILLRAELDELAKTYDWFKVWYTLDRPPEGWKYSTGFINDELVRDHLPAPGPETQVLICGPPPMIKFAVMPAFQKLGFTEQMYAVW